MIRVALITSGILPVPAIKGGAVETLSTYLCEQFDSSKNFSVDLFTCDCEGLENYCKKYKKINLIKVIPNNNDKKKALWIGRVERHLGIHKGYNEFQYALRRYYNDINYDITIFENTLRNICVLKRIKKSGLWIYHVHNNVERGGGDKSVSNIKKVESKIDFILACSDFTRNDYAKYFPSDRIYTFYNAVDLQSYSEVSHKDHSGNEKYTFLISGRIVPEKGFLEAITAFSNMNNDDARLLIAGDLQESVMGDKEYVKKVKKAANKKSNIEFLGFIPYEKMKSIYNTADCVLVPSQWDEPFGLVVAEAMSMKKPLIATKLGGIAEIVDDNCAFLIEKGENGIAQMQKYMQYLIEHPEDGVKMGKCGFERMKNHNEFNKEYYLSNLFSILSNNDTNFMIEKEILDSEE